MSSNSDDLILSNSSAQVVSTNYVENKDPLADNTARVIQQQVTPTAIQARNLGNILSSAPDSSDLGSALTLQYSPPTGTSVSFLFRISDPQGRQIVAIPDVSFYIGTLGAGDFWPNANFGEGNMPTSVFNSWADTDNFNVATRATIRNNTGSTQLVTCFCRYRIVANPGVAGSTNATFNSNTATAPGLGGL